MSQTKAQLIGDLTQALEFITTASTPADGLYLKATNQLALATNSVDRITAGTSELVINESGASVDFRVEGDTDANLLFIDASTDRVGIGTSSPSDLLSLSGTGTILSVASGPVISLADTSNRTLKIAGPGATANAVIGTTTNHNLEFITGNTVKAAVDTSGRLGIGTASPSFKTEIVDTLQADANLNYSLVVRGDDSGTTDESAQILLSAINATSRGSAIAAVLKSGSNDHDLVFKTSAASATPTERLRIVSDGKIGMNQSAPNADLDITSSTEDSTGTLARHGIRLAAVGSADEDVIPITGCFLDNKDRSRAGIGFICKTASSAGFAGAIGFYTRSAADGSGLLRTDERMRIDENGEMYIGRTSDTNSEGITLSGNGFARFVRDSSTPLVVNRQVSDGVLVSLQQAGAVEGDITVNGGTVSFNGAHLSRWSQLPGGGERIEILRGSVLSNIDEMCEWGEEDNEQHNRMKVSDVEGDKNVAGVFQGWDDDDDTYTNDFYCAMTGDFIIRIAQGVTVERGDLLMSAGDGTAKPQDDDIIRSNTIAKVTSTNVSCTYDDGSYCVPCVLMAC